MERFKQLINFLVATSKTKKQTIEPSWDGHKWITLVDLPLLEKFGLGVSSDRLESINMAVDHALLFVDDYLKEHPEVKLDNTIGGFDYDVMESKNGSILLKVTNK